jgi:hypothetical protein
MDMELKQVKEASSNALQEIYDKDGLMLRQCSNLCEEMLASNS